MLLQNWFRARLLFENIFILSTWFTLDRFEERLKPCSADGYRAICSTLYVEWLKANARIQALSEGSSYTSRPETASDRDANVAELYFCGGTASPCQMPDTPKYHRCYGLSRLNSGKLSQLSDETRRVWSKVSDFAARSDFDLASGFSMQHLGSPTMHFPQ
jgi:hypothetical protein